MRSSALLTALALATASMADQPTTDDGQLTVEDTIGDLLDHPALAGFGARTLPWANRDYDRDIGLRQIAGLLPYHSAVNPQVVVEGLNRLIADAGKGEQVFYEIYPEAQRWDRPDLNETGLFYFRGRPGAPFAVIAPGGGFSYVGSIHEGFPYAVEINEHGYNVFVLTYRTGQGGGTATRDLAQAIGFIFDHADDLGVARDDYSLWGSSAGARMAASIGSHGTQAFDGADLPGPAAVVMAYTAHADHAAQEPPTFVVVGGRDGISPASSMEPRVETLRAQGTEVEYHLYDNLGHGFGTGRGTSAEGWIANAVRFWEGNMASYD
jgi:acetyl esterase/lipase